MWHDLERWLAEDSKAGYTVSRQVRWCCRQLYADDRPIPFASADRRGAVRLVWNIGPRRLTLTIAPDCPAEWLYENTKTGKRMWTDEDDDVIPFSARVFFGEEKER